MFYYLYTLYITNEYTFLDSLWNFQNLFRYITVRSILALFTAFFLSLLIAPPIIKWLRKLNVSENINKKDSVQLSYIHEGKKGTPTMGGIIIIICIVLSTLLWGRFDNLFVVGAVCLVLLMGLIGFFDDLIKLSKSDRPGLTVVQKSLWQLGVGVIYGIFIYVMFSADGAGRGMTENGDLLRIQLPFFRDIIVDPKNPLIENINYIGFFYIPFTILVLFSTSNAVNLTDGLDGLAIGTSTITAIALMIITYATSHYLAAEYLKIYHIKEAGELTVFVGALVGSCLGFLWFNGKPALVFMGDTGSLAIGASIGYVSLVIHQELLLFLIGGIFVVEALSVLIQVGYYKMTKKRFFKCAPLHHHFEFIGWPESRIVNRFLIVAALLAILGIISLKLR